MQHRLGLFDLRRGLLALDQRDRPADPCKRDGDLRQHLHRAHRPRHHCVKLLALCSLALRDALRVRPCADVMGRRFRASVQRRAVLDAKPRDCRVQKRDLLRRRIQQREPQVRRANREWEPRQASARPHVQHRRPVRQVAQHRQQRERVQHMPLPRLVMLRHRREIRPLVRLQQACQKQPELLNIPLVKLNSHRPRTLQKPRRRGERLHRSKVKGQGRTGGSRRGGHG